MSEASLIWRDVHILLREKNKVQNNKYSRPSAALHSASADSTNLELKIFGERNFQKVPKSKTWICCPQATIYIAFTVYWYY